MLTPELLPRLQQLLADADLDGWLLYDFRGTNAIAAGLLGFGGLCSRRVFAFIPRTGLPIGIQHAIEPGPWAKWPKAWPLRVYSGWRALEDEVASLVQGKRVAMEYSPGDAIPYLDRIPAGVLELVRASGATVVSSGELVSQVYATWTPAHLAAHQRAAQHIALGGVHLGCVMDAAATQVQAQLSVVTCDLHGVEELHGRQALLEQPLQRGWRGQSHGRDAARHGAQYLLTLFDLAGQQTRHNLHLLCLLTHHAAHGLLGRRPGHHPRRQNARQSHCEHGHQHQPQDQGSRHGPARRLGR
jgi:hypothetical protein